MVSVIQAKCRFFEEGEYIGRELLLIKVSCTSKKREEIMGIAQLVQAKIVDVSSSAVLHQRLDCQC